MYHKPGSPIEYNKPNRGLRREAFRSHFLLFVLDTVMMTGLLTCGIVGVIYMDGEIFSTPPFYVASFLSASLIMAKATVGGCFSVFGLYVKEKPDEPKTALVIFHLVLSIITFVGFFVSIIVFGFSKVLSGCASSNDTPGCSNYASIYKGLGAVTLVLIILSIALSAFGVYLFYKFAREFNVNPYRRATRKRPRTPPRTTSNTISVHHDEVFDDNRF